MFKYVKIGKDGYKPTKEEVDWYNKQLQECIIQSYEEIYNEQGSFFPIIEKKKRNTPMNPIKKMIKKLLLTLVYYIIIFGMQIIMVGFLPLNIIIIFIKTITKKQKK